MWYSFFLGKMDGKHGKRSPSTWEHVPDVPQAWEKPPDEYHRGHLSLCRCFSMAKRHVYLESMWMWCDWWYCSLECLRRLNFAAIVSLKSPVWFVETLIFCQVENTLGQPANLSCQGDFREAHSSFPAHFEVAGDQWDMALQMLSTMARRVRINIVTLNAALSAWAPGPQSEHLRSAAWRPPWIEVFSVHSRPVSRLVEIAGKSHYCYLMRPRCWCKLPQRVKKGRSAMCLRMFTAFISQENMVSW